MRDYSNISDEELEIIIRDGLKSEFWKWFTHKHDEGQKLIFSDAVRISKKIRSLDDLLLIQNLLASYNSREEYFNWPLAAMKAIEIERNNKSK